ncbi:MAG: hypothetical protein A2V89_01525 [Gammaproteobacteria bacterium RBG_16_37_9]|nr:MAG: hypothetical protein A2V89_01525 [Gammaproteobacteria bacterium RBG_16_37_9]
MRKKSQKNEKKSCVSIEDLDKKFDKLMRFKAQYKKKLEKSETADCRLEKLKKILGDLDKELNESMLKETGALIDNLERLETDDITLGTWQEQETKKNLEEDKQRFVLKPNASASGRKQYIKDIVSLFKDNAHKDPEIGLVGNERKPIGN